MLPNGISAVVDIRKLRDYCLNPDNPRGGNKARVFAAALGLTASDAAWLRQELLTAARTRVASVGEVDIYGRRYVIEVEIVTDSGRRATVRSGWIILHGGNFPRLTTCYVSKRRRDVNDG